jgi:mRNA interferase MazF
MADKITTVRQTELGERIGQLGDADIVRLNRAVVSFLGIANGPQAS